MPKVMRRLPYFILSAVVVISEILLLFAAVSDGSCPPEGENVVEMNSGWTLKDGTSVALPYQVYTGDETIVLRGNLPELIGDKMLYVQTDYQRVSVTIDGKAVQASGFSEDGLLPLTCSGKWTAVALPGDASGDTIELTVGNSGSKPAVEVCRVLFGHEDAIRIELLNGEGGMIFAFIAMLLIAIGMFVLAFIMRTNGLSEDIRKTVWLGITVLLSAIWIFSDGDLQGIYFVQSKLFFMINLYSYMFLPVALLFFAREYRHGGSLTADIINCLIMLVSIGASVSMLLGLMKLYVVLMITHVEIAVAFVSLAIVVLRQIIAKGDKTLRPIFAAMTILAATSAADIALYYTTSRGDNSLFFRYGMLMFVSAFLANTLRNTERKIKRARGFEALAQSLPSGICRVNCTEPINIEFANDFLYEMFGYSAMQGKSVDITKVLDGEEMYKTLTSIREAVKNKTEHFEVELKCRRRDGVRLWALARCSMNLDFSVVTVVLIDITERKNAQERLRISEMEYRVVVEHSGRIINRFSIADRSMNIAPEEAELFGLPEYIENVPDSIIAAGVISKEHEAAYRRFFDNIIDGREPEKTVLLRRGFDGDWAWYSLDYTTVFDDDGKPVTALISLENVTRQREHELAYEKWQESYRSMPPERMSYYEFSLTNNTYECGEGELLGEIPDNIKINFTDIVRYLAENKIYPDDRRSFLDFYSRDRLMSCFSYGIRSDYIECRCIVASGEPLWIKANVQLISDPYSSDTRVFMLINDIDEQKRTELELEARSVQDSLTGILNRGAFIDKCGEILNSGGRHTLIIADLDDFKSVNDTFGHQTGDALIVDFARKFASRLKEGDLCGRLGGDEFVALLRDSGDASDGRVDAVGGISFGGEGDITVTVSIGAAVSSPECASFNELYRRADIALYEAKRLGRDRSVFYDCSMDPDDNNNTGD